MAKACSGIIFPDEKTVMQMTESASIMASSPTTRESFVSDFSDPRNPFNYPINPDFGHGVYRRRIRLEQLGNSVDGKLEDCNHGFCVMVYHDGEKVTAIEPEHKRVPYTTCGGAGRELQALVGTPLGLSSQELAERVNPRANCTHWLDLTLLAIRHAARNETVRQYDVEVPDEDNRATDAKVFRNNELVHHWLMRDWVLQAPEEMAGNTLFRGFSAWANSAFTDEEDKEAAFILQKGYFVSRARRFDIEKVSGESAAAHMSMRDACYSYSAPQRDSAVRTSGTTRDFTDTPEELLTFK